VADVWEGNQEVWRFIWRREMFVWKHDLFLDLREALQAFTATTESDLWFRRKEDGGDVR